MHLQTNILYILQKIDLATRICTFMTVGSFHGPLLDRRHPPASEHVHDPPRKSGSWLKEPNKKQGMHKICILRKWRKHET